MFYTKLAILERINSGICEVPGIDRASIFNKPGTKDEYEIARYHKDLPLCDALALFMVAAPLSDVAAVAFLRKNPAYTRVLISKNTVSNADYIQAARLLGLCNNLQKNYYTTKEEFLRVGSSILVQHCRGKILKRTQQLNNAIKPILLKMEGPTSTNPFTTLDTAFEEGFDESPETFTGKKFNTVRLGYVKGLPEERAQYV